MSPASTYHFEMPPFSPWSGCSIWLYSNFILIILPSPMSFSIYIISWLDTPIIWPWTFPGTLCDQRMSRELRDFIGRIAITWWLTPMVQEVQSVKNLELVFLTSTVTARTSIWNKISIYQPYSYICIQIVPWINSNTDLNIFNEWATPSHVSYVKGIATISVK